MARAAVVGAGQSGLIAARLLAEGGVETTMLERLPAPGGQEPEGAIEKDLAARAAQSGVTFRLGTCALRWNGSALATLGIDGADTLAVDALVIATGTRPATRGELGIAGDRCAGILPATAAVHLIEAGVLPGHRPVIYGGGAFAARSAVLLLEGGSRQVTIVTADPPVAALPVDVRLVTGWRIASANGRPRLSTLTLERGAAREVIAADALVLAVGRIPMRNIEGAVSPQPAAGPVVDCHSAADPKRVDDAERVAAAAVERTLSVIERAPVPATRREHALGPDQLQRTRKEG
jgi:NADPH-dependent 2,4-dienoyl-CoA reductase/sulfur reductase-like enzyme